MKYLREGEREKGGGSVEGKEKGLERESKERRRGRRRRLQLSHLCGEGYDE